uniref:Uncharacterized protein n=1 Tax=Arundo donax TaxID=35708 RepID=A0A0A9EM35_ARUDO
MNISKKCTPGVFCLINIDFLFKYDNVFVLS